MNVKHKGPFEQCLACTKAIETGFNAARQHIFLVEARFRRVHNEAMFRQAREQVMAKVSINGLE